MNSKSLKLAFKIALFCMLLASLCMAQTKSKAKICFHCASDCNTQPNQRNCTDYPVGGCQRTFSPCLEASESFYINVTILKSSPNGNVYQTSFYSDSDCQSISNFYIDSACGTCSNVDNQSLTIDCSSSSSLRYGNSMRSLWFNILFISFIILPTSLLFV
eukprot:TRINITY_DN1521_c0_g1_i1.p1 TRINITY_DN1521_c0_g1~~TRINITY_DN1521_c0_g1_i1.p1  ORF type:complete len:160 (-),score=44.53 TRINITY_DN1521_c0_g1_i1:172-651(-)